MPFQLEKPTQILITNANPRRELHGDERVRAIDIAFSLTGENTLLDLIEPGLREHHYCNNALKSGQESLPDVVIPLPNLLDMTGAAVGEVPLAYHYAKGEKWRGYRFVWDWGVDEAHVDFTDVVLANLHYEINEGGSVTIMGTIQYNGEELQDNDVYGELSGLASEGEISAMLLAPAELVPARTRTRTPMLTRTGVKPDGLHDRPRREGACRIRARAAPQPRSRSGRAGCGAGPRHHRGGGARGRGTHHEHRNMNTVEVRAFRGLAEQGLAPCG